MSRIDLESYLLNRTELMKRCEEISTELSVLRNSFQEYTNQIQQHIASAKRALPYVSPRSDMSATPRNELVLSKNFQGDVNVCNCEFDASEMSTRTYHCLIYEKIKTFRQLVEFSPRQLLAIKNLGRRSLDESIDLAIGHFKEVHDIKYASLKGYGEYL